MVTVAITRRHFVLRKVTTPMWLVVPPADDLLLKKVQAESNVSLEVKCAISSLCRRRRHRRRALRARMLLAPRAPTNGASGRN